MEIERTLAAPGQYLTFRVGREDYAVPLLRVREIIEFRTITRVPGMPPAVRGVINVRSSVLPVVDLGLRFGQGASIVSKRTCIILIELALDSQAMVMGVVADSVSQVLELDAASIQPPPSFGTVVRLDYLMGMGQLGGHFALLLDVDRVLSPSELRAASTVAAEAEPVESSKALDAGA